MIRLKNFQKNVDTFLSISPTIHNYRLGFTPEGNKSASPMKKKSTSKSAFFNLRILTACVFCLLGIAVALFAQGNRTKPVQQNNRSKGAQDAPGTQKPDVVQMVGPVRLDQDLRKLPYIPGKGGIRRATSDSISVHGHGRATISNGDFFFAVVTKAD